MTTKLWVSNVDVAGISVSVILLNKRGSKIRMMTWPALSVSSYPEERAFFRLSFDEAHARSIEARAAVVHGEDHVADDASPPQRREWFKVSRTVRNPRRSILCSSK